jgi:hypothetical protein
VAEMSVFGNAAFKIQFKTSLPTNEGDRAARQSEYAAMLDHVRSAIQEAVGKVTEREGWQVVIVQEA